MVKTDTLLLYVGVAGISQRGNKGFYPWTKDTLSGFSSMVYNRFPVVDHNFFSFPQEVNQFAMPLGVSILAAPSKKKYKPHYFAYTISAGKMCWGVSLFFDLPLRDETVGAVQKHMVVTEVPIQPYANFSLFVLLNDPLVSKLPPILSYFATKIGSERDFLHVCESLYSIFPQNQRLPFTVTIAPSQSIGTDDDFAETIHTMPNKALTLGAPLKSELSLLLNKELARANRSKNRRMSVDTGLTVKFPQPYSSFSGPLAVDYSTILSKLTPETLVNTFEAILQSRHVLVVSSSLELSSTAVMEFYTLLYPLCYPFIFMPSLPGSMLQLLHYPVPSLAGTHRQAIKDAILPLVLHMVDLDSGKVVHPYQFTSPEYGARQIRNIIPRACFAGISVPFTFDHYLSQQDGATGVQSSDWDNSHLLKNSANFDTTDEFTAVDTVNMRTHLLASSDPSGETVDGGMPKSRSKRQLRSMKISLSSDILSLSPSASPTHIGQYGDSMTSSMKEPSGQEKGGRSVSFIIPKAFNMYSLCRLVEMNYRSQSMMQMLDLLRSADAPLSLDVYKMSLPTIQSPPHLSVEKTTSNRKAARRLTGSHFRASTTSVKLPAARFSMANQASMSSDDLQPFGSLASGDRSSEEFLENDKRQMACFNFANVPRLPPRIRRRLLRIVKQCGDIYFKLHKDATDNDMVDLVTENTQHFQQKTELRSMPRTNFSLENENKREVDYSGVSFMNNISSDSDDEAQYPSPMTMAIFRTFQRSEKGEMLQGIDFNPCYATRDRLPKEFKSAYSYLSEDEELAGYRSFLPPTEVGALQGDGSAKEDLVIYKYRLQLGFTTTILSMLRAFHRSVRPIPLRNLVREPGILKCAEHEVILPTHARSKRYDGSSVASDLPGSSLPHSAGGRASDSAACALALSQTLGISVNTLQMMTGYIRRFGVGGSQTLPSSFFADSRYHIVIDETKETRFLSPFLLTEQGFIRQYADILARVHASTLFTNYQLFLSDVRGSSCDDQYFSTETASKALSGGANISMASNTALLHLYTAVTGFLNYSSQYISDKASGGAGLKPSDTCLTMRLQELNSFDKTAFIALQGVHGAYEEFFDYTTFLIESPDEYREFLTYFVQTQFFESYLEVRLLDPKYLKDRFFAPVVTNPNNTMIQSAIPPPKSVSSARSYDESGSLTSAGSNNPTSKLARDGALSYMDSTVGGNVSASIISVSLETTESVMHISETRSYTDESEGTSYTHDNLSFPFGNEHFRDSNDRSSGTRPQSSKPAGPVYYIQTSQGDLVDALMHMHDDHLRCKLAGITKGPISMVVYKRNQRWVSWRKRELSVYFVKGKIYINWRKLDSKGRNKHEDSDDEGLSAQSGNFVLSGKYFVFVPEPMKDSPTPYLLSISNDQRSLLLAMFTLDQLRFLLYLLKPEKPYQSRLSTNYKGLQLITSRRKSRHIALGEVLESCRTDEDSLKINLEKNLIALYSSLDY